MEWGDDVWKKMGAMLLENAPHTLARAARERSLCAWT